MAITVQEFDDRCYNNLEGLKDFCDEYDIDIMNEVKDSSEYTSEVEERIPELLNHWYFDDLAEWLNSLPSRHNYEYYYEYDRDNWEGLRDSDAGNWYDAVLSEAMSCGYVVNEDDNESDDNESENESNKNKYSVQDDDAVDEDFMSILNL